MRTAFIGDYFGCLADADLRREINDGLQVVENWNSANHDLFRGKDAADRRALSPLFWTHVNPCGRFELDMTSQLDIALPAVPGSRTAANTDTGRPLHDGTEA